MEVGNLSLSELLEVGCNRSPAPRSIESSPFAYSSFPCVLYGDTEGIRAGWAE